VESFLVGTEEKPKEPVTVTVLPLPPENPLVEGEAPKLNELVVVPAPVLPNDNPLAVEAPLEPAAVIGVLLACGSPNPLEVVVEELVEEVVPSLLLRGLVVDGGSEKENTLLLTAGVELAPKENSVVGKPPLPLTLPLPLEVEGTLPLPLPLPLPLTRGLVGEAVLVVDNALIVNPIVEEAGGVALRSEVGLPSENEEGEVAEPNKPRTGEEGGVEPKLIVLPKEDPELEGPVLPKEELELDDPVEPKKPELVVLPKERLELDDPVLPKRDVPEEGAPKEELELDGPVLPKREGKPEGALLPKELLELDGPVLPK